MRRCFACHNNKPETEFPSVLSLTCTFCTPFNTGQSPAISRLQARQRPISTERATRHDDSIARSMLYNAKSKLDFKAHAGPLAPPLEIDDRPLIDKLHEATFTNPIGLQWIEDKYALRTLVRRAHCFTLDATTSALVSDFSLAIARDLESSRRMAIPPFPVTWIDLDNNARLNRIKELGIGLTPQAAGETEAGPAVSRVGWLIHPDATEGYYATYVCEVEQGVTLAPLSYWWHSGVSIPMSEGLKVKARDVDIERMDRMSFGLRNSGVSPVDAVPSPTPMHPKLMVGKKYPQQVQELMEEIGGELRHIWGFLIALGAGQLGMETKYSSQPKPVTERQAPNGKPLLPLEHKVLHLHLSKRMTPDKVLVRMLTHHKHRWHEVRSHFRLLKSGVRVPVKSHERGDERLGKIVKTYKVEK
jgi:hypothetical protein